MQNDFTRRAEAAVRLRRRFGMNRRPTTMEVALAVLESNQRIEALLGDLVSLGRVVRLYSGETTTIRMSTTLRESITTKS
jgi:hypothetical protein